MVCGNVSCYSSCTENMKPIGAIGAIVAIVTNGSPSVVQFNHQGIHAMVVNESPMSPLSSMVPLDQLVQLDRQLIHSL